MASLDLVFQDYAVCFVNHKVVSVLAHQSKKGLPLVLRLPSQSDFVILVVLVFLVTFVKFILQTVNFVFIIC